jgi:hypothetical protein
MLNEEWITEKGNKITVEEMTNAHSVYTLAKILRDRKLHINTEYIKEVLNEILKSNREYREMILENYHEIY